MDQTVINAVIGVVMACGGIATGALGWWARTMWDQGKENADRITKLELTVARDYVSNPELSAVVKDIKDVLVAAVGDLREDIKDIGKRVDGLTQHRRAGDPS
jgi:hypothetical protein